MTRKRRSAVVTAGSILAATVRTAAATSCAIAAAAFATASCSLMAAVVDLEAHGYVGAPWWTNAAGMVLAAILTATIAALTILCAGGFVVDAVQRAPTPPRTPGDPDPYADHSDGAADAPVATHSVA